MTNGRLVLTALALIAVAGCTRGGGEPNQDDLRAALKASGNRGADKAEKLACKVSPERPGYICDYRAPSCNRYTGTCGSVRPFTARFLYAGGRWQFVEDMTPRAAPDPATQALPGIGLAPAESTTAPAATEPPATVPLTSPSAEPITEPEAGPASEPDPRRDTDFDPDVGEGDVEPLTARELGDVARWVRIDARCQIGRGDAYDTVSACEERDRLGRNLEARGLCLSRTAGWRRCE